MNVENVDIHISELLEKVRPDLTPSLTDRATAAIRAARPAPTRSRCRLIAVGLAVALFALGFVPFPAGNAKGALDRAAAAIERTPNLYVQWRMVRDGKETVIRDWHSAEGLGREEEWEDGKLASINCMTVDSRLMLVFADHSGSITDLPPPNPGLETMRLWAREYLPELARWGMKSAEVRTREWKERTLWGGTREFAEITASAERNVYELDPTTGRIIAWTIYRRKDDRWEPWS